MLQAVHAGPMLTHLLRETKSKLLRCEAATVLGNLCISLTTPPNPPSTAPPAVSASPLSTGAASQTQAHTAAARLVHNHTHHQQEKGAGERREAAQSAASVATGVAAQEHLASAALHCTLVEMLQEEGGSSVARGGRGVYDAVALQMLVLMARCLFSSSLAVAERNL